MRTKLTFIFFLFFSQALFAQNKDSIDQQLFLASVQNNLTATALKAHENFYIITDRPWYMPGEEIWFKIYITTNELPFTSSGVLYLSFTDSSGRIIIKKILPVDDNGVSYGAIKLPLDLKRGWYSLGVQTEWNRNFNDGFEKLIYINEAGGTPEKISFLDLSSAGKNNIEFFPEGGSFITGLQNHFGVKVVGKNGETFSVKGFILDSGKDTLAFFETSSDGFGEFTLPATTDKNLSAVIYWNNGDKAIQPLPQMKPEGIILQASVISDKLFYNIESTPGFIAQSEELMLAVTMHHEIVFSKLLQDSNLHSYSDFISINQFPEGIISLGLYTKEGKLVAERNICHYKEKDIVLQKNEINFEQKAKNEIEIALPDTLTGTYSVSITDADLPNELVNEDKKNFENYEEPFSFLKRFENREREMNLYLLARNNHLYDTNQSFVFAYQQGLNISGRLYSKSGKSVSNRTINFFLRNSGLGGFLFSDSLDESGNFELKDLYVEDSTVLCWNINGMNINELNRAKLQLNKNWFDSLMKRHTILQEKNSRNNDQQAMRSLPDAFKQYYIFDSLEKKKTKTLPEVTIFTQQRKKIEELDKTYAGTSLFGGKLAEVLAYDMEEEKGYYLSIFTFLQGRIPGLIINGPIYSPKLSYHTIYPVKLFVNENKIDEPADVASILVSEIAYIKVFKPPYSYLLVSDVPKGGEKPPGLVIAIYLRKTATKIISGPTLSAFQSFSIKGFSLPTSFPEPDYSEKREMENIPDKRITLYWNPDQEFENGKAKIAFYNNDFSKKFLIKIDGINELGEVVSFRQVIEK